VEPGAPVVAVLLDIAPTTARPSESHDPGRDETLAEPAADRKVLVALVHR
jgi:hypothetical protein